MRSRTVSRPWSRWRLTLSTPPISRANASRRARSSSSGCQLIHILRFDDLAITAGERKRFFVQPGTEQCAVAAFDQAADRSGQFEKLRRDLSVQSPLVVHRREKADRDHHEGLVLRRPKQHRKAVDMRAPQPAGHDVAVLAQEATIVFDPGPQQFRALRNLT